MPDLLKHRSHLHLLNLLDGLVIILTCCIIFENWPSKSKRRIRSNGRLINSSLSFPYMKGNTTLGIFICRYDAGNRITVTYYSISVVVIVAFPLSLKVTSSCSMIPSSFFDRI